MIKLLDNRVAQPPSCWVHSENVDGDPASLSDARLKTEKKTKTPVSGDPARQVLSQIEACTYEREDIEQRRLGLVAQEVEQAVSQLAIANAIGSKWHNNDEYNTLDHSRLVSLLTPAVNRLSQQVKDLESKVSGTD